MSLRRIWSAWVSLAAFIGDFQARLLLTTFYFTVAVPFALLVRWTDRLQVRVRQGTSVWARRPVQIDSLLRARRQG